MSGEQERPTSDGARGERQEESLLGLYMLLVVVALIAAVALAWFWAYPAPPQGGAATVTARPLRPAALPADRR